MRIFLGLILLILAESAYCQNFELSGRVYASALPKNGKLFYLINTIPFSPENFVRYDSNYMYHFSVLIAKLRNQNLSVIYFTTDSTFDSRCEHKIQVGKILNTEPFRNLASVNLQSDLFLNESCEFTTYSGAWMTKDEYIVGEYKMKIDDTLYKIKLKDFQWRYTATTSIPAKVCFYEQEGRWKYDKDGEVLTITVSALRNYDLGLAVKYPREFKFKMPKDSTVTTFKEINSEIILSRISSE